VTPWAVAVDLEQVRLLARLRRMPGLTVCQSDDVLWLRGDIDEAEIAPQLSTIPGARRFDLLPDMQLRPLGRLVPEGHLPEGPWQPLASWLKVELPPMSVVSSAPPLEPVRLRLVRTGEVRDPALLEVSLETLADYIELAPQWRIQRWQLALARETAAAQNKTVLVRGLPLPPLPGQFWTEQEGICVPAGYSWEPTVNAAVVRQLLGLEPQDLALLDPQGTHEVVLPDHWIRTSRSAVRQMRRGAQP
jgi:MoxR-vWA-beta-propeller ternary system protein